MDKLDNQLVLDNLLKNMPGHVYWKNRQGVYLGCNDRQAQSLGITRGRDVIGKTDFELPWNYQLAKRFWENDREVLETSVAKTVEEQGIVNGSAAIVLSLKVPLKDSQGIVIGVLGISVDITQQKRAEAKLIQAKEAAEAAIQVKTEFLENMRHDFRTPMMGIIGCASIIKEKIQNFSKKNEVTEYADYLLTSSESLLQLLNEVLDSIKVAAGTMPILKKRFNLQEIILDIVKLNTARAKEKKLKLFIEHDKNIPKYLIGDPIRLKRIILELVTNALNFTYHGKIKIVTKLIKQIDHTVIIKIMIADTGIGIPCDKQQSVFSQFHRLNPAYEGHYQGAGLGLSIVKQYVDDFDGEIYLESKQNEGSIFTCVIPIKEALVDEPGSLSEIFHLPQEDDQLNMEKMKNISILVVEDDFIASKVFSSFLTNIGCKFKLAENGRQALLEAKKEKYDIIFMDIGLPDISGVKVTKLIRKYPKNSCTPIIALTAHVDSENNKECLQAGMNTVLNKPVSEKIILEILQKYLFSN